MATQTYEQLIAGANKIKENELPESNTHSLVGDQLLQMTNKQQEEYSQRIKGTTEYNVSVQFPAGGIDGTNKYTLELAIAKVPAEFRSLGLKCSFLSEGGKLETWEFQTGTFTNVNNWIKCLDNRDLATNIAEWNLSQIANNFAFASKAEARLFWFNNIIHPKSNGIGTVITYKLSSGDWVKERYTSHSGSAYVDKDASWMTIELNPDWNETKESSLSFIKNKPDVATNSKVNALVKDTDSTYCVNLIDDPFFETNNISGSIVDKYNILGSKNVTFKGMMKKDDPNFPCYIDCITSTSATPISTGLLRLTKDYLESRGIKEGDKLKVGIFAKFLSASGDSKRTIYINGKANEITDVSWHFCDSNLYSVAYTAENIISLDILYRNTQSNEHLHLTGLTIKKVGESDNWFGFQDSKNYLFHRFDELSGNLYPGYKLFNIDSAYNYFNYSSVYTGTGKKELIKVTDLDGYTGNGIKFTATTTGSMKRVHTVVVPDKLISKNKELYLKAGLKIRVTTSEDSIILLSCGHTLNSNTHTMNVQTNKWVDIITPIMRYADDMRILFDFNDSVIMPAVSSIEVAYPCIIEYRLPYTLFSFCDVDPLQIGNYIQNADYFYGVKWAALGDSVTAANGWQKLVGKSIGITTYTRGCGSSALTFDIGRMAVKPDGFYIDRRMLYNSDSDFIASINAKGFTTQITNPTWLEYSNNPDNYPLVRDNDSAYFLIDTKGNSEDRVATIPLDTDIVSIMFYNDFGDWTDETIGSIDDFEINTSINNGRGTFIANLRQCLEKIKTRLPKARIILVVPYHTVSNAYDTNTHKRTTRGIGNEKLRQAYRDIAKTYGYILIDMTKAINYHDVPLFIGDGVHPNSEGDKQIGYFMIDNFVKFKELLKNK